MKALKFYQPSDLDGGQVHGVVYDECIVRIGVEVDGREEGLGGGELHDEGEAVRETLALKVKVSTGPFLLLWGPSVFRQLAKILVCVLYYSIIFMVYITEYTDQ